MTACPAPRASLRSVAWAAALISLSLTSRAAADIITIGPVNPVPPVSGGTSSAQWQVGYDASPTADPRAWVSIDDGTVLQYGSLIVGDDEDFYGEVNVLGNFLAGLNTKLTLTAIGSTSNPTVQIGNEGTGVLSIRGGSTMTVSNQSGDMSIGFDTTGVGYVTVSDPFTILTVEENFFIGQSGIGSLEVLDGALARTTEGGSSHAITIGSTATGVGSVVVDGFNSILRTASNLVVGSLGEGTLVIGDGAIVDVDNTTLQFPNPTTTVGLLGRIEMTGGTLNGLTPTTGFATTVNGYLGGSGLVRGNVSFNDTSSLEAGSGDVLRFDADVSNQGAVTIDRGELRFLAGFANNAVGVFSAPGRVSLENGGTVRFSATLTNNGVISNAHGTTNIHGAIDNAGEIVVARDTVATFHDLVNNTGGTITVLPGGNALFLANLTFQSAATLALGVGMENLGDTSGHVSVSGVATLAGTLAVTLDGGYAPLVGQAFNLITAGGGIVGAFDSILLPPVPNNLDVGVIYSPASVMLEVKIDDTGIGVPGDYNNDGTVNAADYSVWRDRQGQLFALANENSSASTPGLVDQEDYDFWKANFGQTLGSGAGAGLNAGAPEPASVLHLMVAIAVLLPRFTIYRRCGRKG